MIDLSMKESISTTYLQESKLWIITEKQLQQYSSRVSFNSYVDINDY